MLGSGDGCPTAPSPALTFPSASARTAMRPILRFMVREMTARHFLPSFIPPLLPRAASSGPAPLGSSSGICGETERGGHGGLPRLQTGAMPGPWVPHGTWDLEKGCGWGQMLTFSSRLNSFSLVTGELTLDLAKSLKLLERCRESWGRGEGVRALCASGRGSLLTPSVAALPSTMALQLPHPVLLFASSTRHPFYFLSAPAL